MGEEEGARGRRGGGVVQLDTAADSKAAFGVTREGVDPCLFFSLPLPRIQPVTRTAPETHLTIS